VSMKGGGWLDKYGEGKEKKKKANFLTDQGPDFKGPVEEVDNSALQLLVRNKEPEKRKLPQSGVVIDKRTNQAYFTGTKGQTGSFPVLTGSNYSGENAMGTLKDLEKHPERRATPTGYYQLENPGHWIGAHDAAEYNNKIRHLTPIPAHGLPKPKAQSIAFHRTYGEGFDKGEFNRRESLYKCPPGSRYTSYGCVNMQEESYDLISDALPTKDTALVLDSKYPADLDLLRKMEARMKKFGGDIPEYATGGPSPEKALEMLQDGEVYGRPLTERQIELFSMIAGVDTDDEGNIIDAENIEDEYDDDLYRRGGQKRKMPRRRTSKNIQSSLNKLLARNYTLFGDGRNALFDPNAKGWLDKYK